MTKLPAARHNGTDPSSKTTPTHSLLGLHGLLHGLLRRGRMLLVMRRLLHRLHGLHRLHRLTHGGHSCKGAGAMRVGRSVWLAMTAA